MQRCMNLIAIRRISKILLAFIILLLADHADASHLFGADFYYTYVSGNTYTIVLDAYGDCSGSAFPSLATSNPLVQIYDNGNFSQQISLTLTGPGVEVTPVCPAQVNNTTCNGGTIPGIKKFTYSANVTLSGTSSNWRFRFIGNLGNNIMSGRSNSMTNIVVPTAGGSVMVLEATLDNTSAPNSSVNYTTIPTPFFCINTPTQYNPGPVDPDNDNITVNLVPGLEPSGNVTYVSPYTATQPLGVAAGTFSFNSSTGQLGFTPNLVQKSLVVYKVDEYRNGTLVGTSMREMTFVVLNNCNNTAPLPNGLTNIINATQTGPTSIQICEGSTNVISFSVNGSDADGNNITMSYAGLPAGATASISANGTQNPQFTFNWSVNGLTQGNYIFYLTLKDDGCPLASTQTYAYTINVVPFNSALTSGSLPGCIGQDNGLAFVHPQGTDAYNYIWYDINNQVLQQTNNDSDGDTLYSLAPGTYSVYLQNEYGCDSTLYITVPSSSYSVNFQPPAAICLNTPITFQNTSTNNFNTWDWDFGDGGTSQTASPSHTYSQNDSFTVTLIGHTPNGCDDTVSKTIHVEEVIITAQVDDDTICEGASTLLSASGAISYVWTPYNYLDCATCFQTSAFPLNTTTYTVVGTSSSGCTGQDNVTLNVLNTGLTATPEDTGICPHDSLQLHVSGFDSIITWYPSDGLSDSSANPWVHPSNSMSYVIIADYKNGCHDTATINIRYVSDAVVSLPNSITLYPGESYQMDPHGNCLYYQWFPPLGLTATNISNPIAQPPVNTRYFVTGTTEWGCDVRDSIDIYIAEESILDIPNAFTPGADGPNNTLKIIRKGEASLKSFTIFNRWGNKIFETDNIDEGWDGKYHGTPQPMGIYIYIINAEYNTGRKFYKQGNITLIR